jgi:hypothetical protein
MAFRRYHLLYTSPELICDRKTRLAAAVLGMPISQVSLVGKRSYSVRMAA